MRSLCVYWREEKEGEGERVKGMVLFVGLGPVLTQCNKRVMLLFPSTSFTQLSHLAIATMESVFYSFFTTGVIVQGRDDETSESLMCYVFAPCSVLLTF